MALNAFSLGMDGGFNTSVLFVVSAALSAAILVTVLVIAVRHRTRRRGETRWPAGQLPSNDCSKLKLCCIPSTCFSSPTTQNRQSNSSLQVCTSSKSISVISDGALRLPLESSSSFVFIPAGGCAGVKRDQVIPDENAQTREYEDQHDELSSCNSKSIRFFIEASAVSKKHDRLFFTNGDHYLHETSRNCCYSLLTLINSRSLT